MTTEEFERLKAICEKEGFDISQVNSYLIQVSKKDPWDGVEFAQYKFPWEGEEYHFKIQAMTDKMLIDSCGTDMFKDNCKPSTEQAYVDQLKKEAFERFGHIKHDDIFDVTPIGYQNKKAFISLGDNPKWKYDKKKDQLYFECFLLYSKGKWAERVKELINISNENSCIIYSGKRLEFQFRSSFSIDKTKANELGQFLAKQLEAYLNNEINL